MTVPAVGAPAHRRLTFEGIFGTVAAPVEEWSFRLNLGVGEGPDSGATLLTAAANAYSANLPGKLSAAAILRRIKFAKIGADGRYESAPIISEQNIAGLGSPGNGMPLSTAVACSLTTGRRGPTGRGRIYLPAPMVGTLSPVGLMTPAIAQGIATSVAAFLSAINGPAGFGDVNIVSTKGYMTPVQGVRVGVVPDVIRSRREKLLEAYGATVAVNS